MIADGWTARGKRYLAAGAPVGDAYVKWAVVEGHRDRDASLAEDPKGLSGEAVAARAEGIALTPVPLYPSCIRVG